MWLVTDLIGNSYQSCIIVQSSVLSVLVERRGVRIKVGLWVRRLRELNELDRAIEAASKPYWATVVYDYVWVVHGNHRARPDPEAKHGESSMRA